MAKQSKKQKKPKAAKELTTSSEALSASQEPKSGDERDEQLRTRNGKRAFLEAYRANMGSMSQACEAIGITRRTFYNWYNQDDDFKFEVDDMNRVRFDFALSSHNKLIKGIPMLNADGTPMKTTTGEIVYRVPPDRMACEFEMSRNPEGRKLGYGNTLEHTGKNGKPIEIMVNPYKDLSDEELELEWAKIERETGNES